MKQTTNWICQKRIYRYFFVLTFHDLTLNYTIGNLHFSRVQFRTQTGERTFENIIWNFICFAKFMARYVMVNLKTAKTSDRPKLV